MASASIQPLQHIVDTIALVNRMKVTEEMKSFNDEFNNCKYSVPNCKTTAYYVVIGMMIQPQPKITLDNPGQQLVKKYPKHQRRNLK